MNVTVMFLGFVVFWCVGIFALIAEAGYLSAIASRLGRIAVASLAFGLSFTAGQAIVFYSDQNMVAEEG